MSLVTQPVAIIRNVGGFVFDATFEENLLHEAEVTTNPVETGVSVSDHMYMKPYKVTLRVGVGDVLMDTEADDVFAGASRAQVAFDLLTQLQESFEPFSVQTGLRLYENMVLLKLRPTQDKDTSGSFVGEIELSSVKIVSTQTISYTPRAAGKTTHQASAQTNKGQQQGKQITDNPKIKSIASQLLDYLRSSK